MDGHLKFLLEVWGLNQMPKFNNNYSRYEDKLEFPEGGIGRRAQTKTILWEETS